MVFCWMNGMISKKRSKLDKKDIKRESCRSVFVAWVTGYSTWKQVDFRLLRVSPQRAENQWDNLHHWPGEILSSVQEDSTPMAGAQFCGTHAGTSKICQTATGSNAGNTRRQRLTRQYSHHWATRSAISREKHLSKLRRREVYVPIAGRVWRWMGMLGFQRERHHFCFVFFDVEPAIFKSNLSKMGPR